MKQVLSVVLAVLVGVGVAVAVFHLGGFGVPAPVRAAQRLTSPEASVRERAIAHWSEPSGPGDTARLFTDFDVMDALKTQLPAASDEALRDLADHFADAPQWVDQFPDAQERYLLILAGSKDQASGAKALRQLKRFNPSDDLARIAKVLDKLTSHPDPAVRLSALEHAAHYLGRNAEPMVTRLLDDPDQKVARTAWLDLAFIDPASGHTGRWREAPTPIATAMLLSTAYTNPSQLQDILKTIVDDELLMSKFGDAPYLLKYVADGNPIEKFTLKSTQDDVLASLVDDAGRAHKLLTGKHPELLTIPGEQDAETP